MSKRTLSNYDYFLRLDTSGYKGQWLAIAKGKVVAHGKNAATVYRQAAKKYESAEISLAKAPEKQMLVLGFSL